VSLRDSGMDDDSPESALAQGKTKTSTLLFDGCSESLSSGRGDRGCLDSPEWPPKITFFEIEQICILLWYRHLVLVLKLFCTKFEVKRLRIEGATDLQLYPKK